MSEWIDAESAQIADDVLYEVRDNGGEYDDVPRTFRMRGKAVKFRLAPGCVYGRPTHVRPLPE